MPAALYTLLITDQTLEVVGDPIIGWTSLDVTLRRNEPDNGVFSVPGWPWVLEQLRAGARVVVIEHRGDTPGVGQILTAGPIEEWMHEQSDDGDNAGVGNVTVNFASDLALIAGRCTYPNPAVTADDQDIDSWQYTGNAEQALRALINANVGPGALPRRRIPQLVLGATAGVGTNVTVATQRMQPLTEVARDIADTGGDLTFRTRQVGKQILFEVDKPADASAQARFGFALGNMKYRSFVAKGPSATTAIVGGQGEGASRRLIERTNDTDEAVWWRIERLVSEDGNVDLSTLEADATNALAKGAPTTRLTSNVVDGPGARFGIDYVIGSPVAVEVGPGVWQTDIVTLVHLQAWPTAGSLFAAMIGDQSDRTDPIWVQKLREYDERMATVERTVKPAQLP